MQSLHAVLDEPVGLIMKKFWNAWVIELEIGGKSYIEIHVPLEVLREKSGYNNFTEATNSFVCAKAVIESFE